MSSNYKIFKILSKFVIRCKLQQIAYFTLRILYNGEEFVCFIMTEFLVFNKAHFLWSNCKVMTSRQRSCNQMVGCLQQLRLAKWSSLTCCYQPFPNVWIVKEDGWGPNLNFRFTKKDKSCSLQLTISCNHQKSIPYKILGCKTAKKPSKLVHKQWRYGPNS